MEREKQKAQLEKEFDWFIDNLTTLAQKYKGKFVAIKNFKVIGAYGTFVEAIRETVKKEELGTFIVQKCSINPGDNVVIIHSPEVVV